MNKEIRELLAKKEQVELEIKEFTKDLETKSTEELEAFNVELDAKQEELKAIDEEIKTLEAKQEEEIKKAKEQEKKEKKPMELMNLTMEEKIKTDEYRELWLKNLAGKASDQEFMTKAGTSDSASMGAAIPETTLNQIVAKLEQRSALFNLATVYNFKGTLKIPVENASEDAVLHAEGAELSEENLTLSEVTFGLYEVAKLVSISKTVETQSIDALEAFIVDEISRKLAVKVEQLMATGTGSSQPTGVLVDTAITNEITKSTLTYNDVVDVIAALPTMYHAGASFQMSRATFFQNIVGLVDNDGQPIYRLGMAEGKPAYSILGYRVDIIDQYPDFDAASATDKVFTFGDFGYAYRANMGMPATIEKSYQSSFRKGLVDYRGCLIFDSKVVLGEALVRVVKGA